MTDELNPGMSAFNAQESLLDDDPNVGLSSSEISGNTTPSTDQGGATVSDKDVYIKDDDDVKNTDTSTSDDNHDADADVDADVPDYSDDALYSYLQDKGISDPSKIHFLNDNNEEETYDFRSLPVEEQKNILAELNDPGITEYEYSVINYLRQNNTDLDHVIDYFANQRLQAYLQEHPEETPQETYSIDQYTNEELYLSDLHLHYPQLTEEELLNELENAQQNEELFNKKVDALRASYKEQEDAMKVADEERERQEYEDLRTNLINAAGNFNEFAISLTDPNSESLVVEDADKQDILSYLLDRGTDGKSQFIKDIEDPDALIEIAWHRTKGAEVLDGISRYYKDELKKAHKENESLRRQLEKANKRGEGSVVVPSQPKKETNGTKNNMISAWDRANLL